VKPITGRSRFPRGRRTLNLEDHDDLPGAVRELTDGRGPIVVIDAVGMEAHGAPIGRLAHKLAGMLPMRSPRGSVQNPA